MQHLHLLQHLPHVVGMFLKSVEDSRPEREVGASFFLSGVASLLYCGRKTSINTYLYLFMHIYNATINVTINGCTSIGVNKPTHVAEVPAVYYSGTYLCKCPCMYLELSKYNSIYVHTNIAWRMLFLLKC